MSGANERWQITFECAYKKIYTGSRITSPSLGLRNMRVVDLGLQGYIKQLSDTNL